MKKSRGFAWLNRKYYYIITICNLAQDVSNVLIPNYLRMVW